eukprot:2965690-Alexandrium_andersonii.AAC.1
MSLALDIDPCSDSANEGLDDSPSLDGSCGLDGVPQLALPSAGCEPAQSSEASALTNAGCEPAQSAEASRDTGAAALEADCDSGSTSPSRKRQRTRQITPPNQEATRSMGRLMPGIAQHLEWPRHFDGPRTFEESISFDNMLLGLENNTY